MKAPGRWDRGCTSASSGSHGTRLGGVGSVAGCKCSCPGLAHGNLPAVRADAQARVLTAVPPAPGGLRRNVSPVVQWTLVIYLKSAEGTDASASD